MTVHSSRWSSRSGVRDGAFVERLLRYRNALDDLGDERVAGDALGERLVAEHEPVAEHVVRQIEHVLRTDVHAPAHERERPRREDEVDGRARAGTELDVPGDLGEAIVLGL